MRDGLPEVDKFPTGLPLNALMDGANEAAAEAAALSPSVLAEITAEACAIGDCSNEDALLSTLAARCSSAPSLVTEFLAKLEQHG